MAIAIVYFTKAEFYNWMLVTPYFVNPRCNRQCWKTKANQRSRHPFKRSCL